MSTPSQDVTSLIGDGVHIRWNLGTPLGTGVVVTYSFPSTAAAYDTDSGDSFQALGAAYHANVRAALDIWSAAAGIAFVEVPDAVNGEIRFSMFDMSGNTVAGGGQTAGFAYYPSYSYTSYGDEDTYFINYQGVGGDVFLNSVFYGASANSIAFGTDGFSVLLHEIGHAIGFQHPHNGGNIITPGHDNGDYTIMSYNRTYAQSTLGTVDVEALQYLYGTHNYFAYWDTATALLELTGTDNADWLRGTLLADFIQADAGDDRVDGLDGNDILHGGDGRDILNGGDGDDILIGGHSTDDLRDVIYGAAGNDTIDGGYGNDELRGDAGDDTIAGGFGADLVIGGAGNDVMTGSAFGDEVHGGAGNDFINGGFGHDRVNGGTGADKFYHLGIADHGADWIQDYNAADGDVLMWGGGAATADEFLIQRAETASAGVAGVEEVFVTHIPSGNLLWALVDGDAQAEINIQIAGQVYDLLG